jgi:hypothetical protein
MSRLLHRACHSWGAVSSLLQMLTNGPPNPLSHAAMVSFCNPGVLGSPSQFRRHFEAPILAGREPGGHCAASAAA